MVRNRLQEANVPSYLCLPSEDEETTDIRATFPRAVEYIDAARVAHADRHANPNTPCKALVRCCLVVSGMHQRSQNEAVQLVLCQHEVCVLVCVVLFRARLGTESKRKC